MTSSIDTLPGRADRAIEPKAVALLTPLSLKVIVPGDGDALGDGETDEVPPPDVPQAETAMARTTTATHLFKPAVSPQFRFKRYLCRLLDRPRRLTRLKRIGLGSPPRGELCRE